MSWISKKKGSSDSYVALETVLRVSKSKRPGLCLGPGQSLDHQRRRLKNY